MATTEMIITVIWSKPMLTPRNRTVLVSRNEGNEVLESPYQISPTPTMKSRMPDGGDHLQGGRGVLEGAGDQLEDQALERREHEEAEGRRIGPRHPVLGVQPVEDEDGEGGDGAVGEVEDPRGLVGQHQAHARQAVDRSGRDADDDERKEI